jgi:ankyrin repeat protein
MGPVILVPLGKILCLDAYHQVRRAPRTRAHFPGGSYFVLYEHLFRPPDQTQLQDCSATPNTLHELARAASWPKLPPYPSYIDETADASYELDKSFTNRHQRLDLILESGVDISGYDSKHQTPLLAFIASSRQHELDPQTGAFVEHLINKGADIHRRDKRGKTALHLAVQ